MPAWFPNFLNIWPAAIAAALAVPALLVLYFLKLRRREMPVPSTLLWRKAIQDLQVNAPFQRLRRNLLLLLQMLLLLLLLLALARPVVSFTPPAGQLNVFLIDRSASMSAKDIDGNSGKSRLDEAKRRAKAQVDTMEKNATAMVIAFDDAAETVQSFTSDTGALKQAIDSIQPTDRRSRLKQAYQLAEAQSSYFMPEQNRSIAPRPSVWLYSDARVLDANELSIRADVKYDKIGSENAPNIAIVALSASRNYERPNELQVFGRLANFGPVPVNTDVQLFVNDQVVSIKSNLALAPERWNDQAWLAAHPGAKDADYVVRDSVEFQIDMPDAGVIKLEQTNKQNDVLPADDVAWLVVPPPKPLRILLVTDENYWLEHLLSSLTAQQRDQMLPLEYEQKQPTDYDVIIFDRYDPKKLPPAGNFMYFDCVPPDSKLKAAQEDGKPVLLEQVSVLDWKRDHPIFRSQVLWSRLYAKEMLKLEVPAEAEVLVEGIKGPMIVLYKEARRTHLVVAFDLWQSTLPVPPMMGQTFPMFGYYAMQFLALGSEMNVRQSFDPGSTPTIPRLNLQRLDKPTKEVNVSGPLTRRTVTVPESGDFVLPALDKVGLYKLTPPIPGYEQLAVNLLDANESNLIPAEVPPGGEAVEAAGKSRGRLELWWWLCAAGVLLLAVEWWVYTRRVHL